MHWPKAHQSGKDSANDRHGCYVRLLRFRPQYGQCSVKTTHEEEHVNCWNAACVAKMEKRTFSPCIGQTFFIGSDPRYVENDMVCNDCETQPKAQEVKWRKVRLLQLRCIRLESHG